MKKMVISSKVCCAALIAVKIQRKEIQVLAKRAGIWEMLNKYLLEK